MTKDLAKKEWRSQIRGLERSLDDVGENAKLRNQYIANIEQMKRGYYVIFKEHYRDGKKE